MTYPIQKMHKAHYVLMNIECDQETLVELEHAFKFNDAVLRHLIVKMDRAWTTPSPMMKEEKSRSVLSGDRAERGERSDRGDRSDRGERTERAPAPAVEAEAAKPAA